MPVKSSGRGKSSSTFSWASTPVPAATSPTRGTWRTGPGIDDGLGGRVVADLDGPGLGGVPAQVPLALEHGQMGVDRRRRGEADRLADLADRRGIAPLPHRLGDEVQNLLALAAQCLGHGLPLVLPVLSSAPRPAAPLSVGPSVRPRGCPSAHLFVGPPAARAANICLCRLGQWRPKSKHLFDEWLDTNTCSWSDEAMTNTCSIRRGPTHHRPMERPSGAGPEGRR